MALSDEIKAGIDGVLAPAWSTVDGQVVPETKDIVLKNGAVSASPVVCPCIAVIGVGPTACNRVDQTTGSTPSLALDGLHLEVLLQPPDSAFATHPGVLVATEWCGWVELATVEFNLARAQSPGHRHRTIRVTTPDTTGKAVLGVVGHGHGLVLIVVSEDGQDGAEDFRVTKRCDRAMHLNNEGLPS